MAGNKDWIPERDTELVEFARKWKAGLEDSSNVAAFGWQ
jgi:hypothetical protein